MNECPACADKAQSVRLFDVYALGPFMIWLAMQSRPSSTARVLLALAGVATIAYNGANYLRNVQT